MYYECENPTCRFELYENEIICPLCDEAQYKRIPIGLYSKEDKIEIARAEMQRKKEKCLSISLYLFLIATCFFIPTLFALRIPLPQTGQYKGSDLTKFMSFFIYSGFLNFILVGFPTSFSSPFYRRLRNGRIVSFGLLRFIYSNRYLDTVYYIVAYYIMTSLGNRWVEPGLLELQIKVSARASNVGFIYDMGLPMYHIMCISILIIYSVCSLFNISNYSFEIHCRKEDHKRRRYRPITPSK